MKKLFLFLLLLAYSSMNFYAQKATADKSDYSISVNGEMKSPEEVLSRYIQHKSISGNEKDAGVWLRGVCKENGLFITQFGDENGNFNYAASLFPLSDSLPNILLLNHMDVVPEGEIELWEYPPWSGMITETEVWGRGAFDNKGAAIMQLFSLLKYKSELPSGHKDYNVTFLSVCTEETQSGGGARYVASEYINVLKPVVVIGEGATELGSLVDPESMDSTKQFGISITQKRPCWLKLELAVETSGHGSAPQYSYASKDLTIALSKLLQKKRKAIFNSVNKSMLRSLGEQEKGIVKFIMTHPGFFKPVIVPQIRAQAELFALYSNTISLTVIENHNSTINYIPGKAEAYLDCRIMPGVTKDDFIEFVKDGLENDSIVISEVLHMDKAAISDEDGLFYKHMEEAVKDRYPGAQVYPIMLPNFNDVAWFRAKGIEALSIIPVEMEANHMECIHKENERIPILALYQGIDTYVEFLKRCKKN